MSREYVIDDRSCKMRLDVYLISQIPDVTRSRLKKAIEDGEVLVNGKVVKAGYDLRIGDRVVADISDTKPTMAQAEDLPIDIVYEDDDIVVVNKAQGMVVHPAVGNWSGTLVNALLHNVGSLSEVNGDFRPGIVHRIDKDTSGLLVIAKNDKAHNSLSSQIADKQCKRYYVALVQGRVKDYTGEIITNIARDPKNRLRMAVCDSTKGKIAHTIYTVDKYFQGYTLVRFELKTGRTHQIRVHSAYMKHPIVGDKLYNPNKSKFHTDGQLLHAYKLVLTHPTTGKLMEFTAPIPEYFTKILEGLQIDK
ncbi:MAG: RluA family pseudouridine synthase [Clostridiales bacterium]|nr:RluA family pseudouridine synthase [Clostridiales bacterium]